MAINKKLIHFNTFENFNSKKLSANAENTQYTIGINGSIQTGSPDILYQSIVYIKDTKQQWTHGQLYNCSDSENQLKTYTFQENSNFQIITQEEFEKIKNADIVYFYDEPNNIQVTVKDDNNGDISFQGYYLSSYPDYVKIYSITISQASQVIMTLDSISLSDYISGADQSSYIVAVYDEFVDGAQVQIVENKDSLSDLKPTVLLLTNIDQNHAISLLGPYVQSQENEFLYKFIGEHNDQIIECVFNIIEYEIVGTLHIKSEEDLSNYPTKTSDLENDSGFITIEDIPEEYVTETELNDKGFLTEHQDISHLATKNELANVATTGSYNDLTDTPTIPTQVTESIVSGWGFTKNNGTYVKPSNGIPTTDLSSEVQTKLNKANTALQSIPSEYITKTELNAKGYSTTDYVNNKVAALVDGAPEALNTLDELAAALKDNADIVTILENSIGNKADKSSLSTVAISGSYNDLSNKPTIPSEVTESTISGWGFTKNTGTYSKPSSGIPKSDLSNELQISLGKADTALQSYTEQYKGTVTGVKINGSSKSPSNGIVDLGTVITSHQDISGKQDILISGTNIKTINGQSILGSGNIIIEGGTGNSDANVQAVDEISTIIDVDLDKYIVETTDNNIALDNNKYYKKTNVSSSISITLNMPEDNTVFTSFSIEFTTSESGTSVSLPDTIKWINGELPTFENDFTYQISICNGLGVCAKYA